MKINPDLLKVDIYRLDEEWIELPQVYMEVAENILEIKKKLDEAKEELEIIKAELYRDIRRNPDVYGIVDGKLTEVILEQTIRLDASYRKARKRVINLKYRLEKAKIIAHALEHKKSALENLIKLMTIQYFMPEGVINTKKGGSGI